MQHTSLPDEQLVTTYTLNEGQGKAHHELVTLILENTGQSIGVLIGYAGTGKSFLTNKVVDYCVEEMPILRFSMTAPTHKAVKELKNKCNYPERFLFATIHSLLGLKQDVDGKGRAIYKKDYDHTSDKIRNTDVLIVDEASMLNKELFDYIMDHQKKLGFKVIFVGDQKQINPVGELESSPFLPAVQEKHNMKVVVLEEIVRQADNNPIIGYATSVRRQEPYDFKGKDKGDTGIQCLNKTMFALRPILEKYFLSLCYQGPVICIPFTT